jgi:hypothetical protein
MGKVRIFDAPVFIHTGFTKKAKREYALRDMAVKKLWALQDEGKEAFDKEVRRRGSPYSPGTPERIAWVQGWDNGYHYWRYEREERRRLFGDYAAWPVVCAWR